MSDLINLDAIEARTQQASKEWHFKWKSSKDGDVWDIELETVNASAEFEPFGHGPAARQLALADLQDINQLLQDSIALVARVRELEGKA